jgi:hypothetical protein
MFIEDPWCIIVQTHENSACRATFILLHFAPFILFILNFNTKHMMYCYLSHFTFSSPPTIELGRERDRFALEVEDEGKGNNGCKDTKDIEMLCYALTPTIRMTCEFLCIHL